MGCLCGLDDQAVQDLIRAINYLGGALHGDSELKSRLEILYDRLLTVEVNDGN